MKFLYSLLTVCMLAVAAQAQSDAKALAIVQKSIEASGGKDKMMAIKTMIRKMEISMPFGTSESESYYKNGKFYMKSSMNGAVVMEQKYDGNRATMNGMQGSQTIDDEKMLKRMEMQGKIFPSLSLTDEDITLTYSGTDKIAGKPCDKITSKDKDGNETTLFFNSDNGLMVRMITKGEWQGTVTETTMDLSDYKPIEGILFAHKMDMNTGQFQMTMKITEIKLNAEVADAMFMIE